MSFPIFSHNGFSIGIGDSNRDGKLDFDFGLRHQSYGSSPWGYGSSGAEIGFNTRVGDLHVSGGNNGALTIPANITGNPAVSIPIEPFQGLPVGMQVIGRHHQDQLLLDLALVAERTCPWPLVAPGSPH